MLRACSASRLRGINMGASSVRIGLAAVVFMLSCCQHNNLHRRLTPPTETCTRQLKPLQEVDLSPNYRRRLWNLSGFSDPKSVALDTRFGSSDVHSSGSSVNERFYIPNLSTYGIHNIVMTRDKFTREMFLLYYDPVKDAFDVFLDEKKDAYYSQVYSPQWGRLKDVVPILTTALREHFPDRFRGVKGGSPEFITYFSTGDVPAMTCDCVDKAERAKRPSFCRNDEFAPILQFGSVYKDVTILPNLVTMPVWPHLNCFREWQLEGTVCQELRLRSDIAGMVGGEDALQDAIPSKQVSHSVWDTLIPTLIWRGSDFPFLHCIHPNILLVRWSRDIAPRLERFGSHARGVIMSLLDIWDYLSPRWKAVTLTAMARVEAQESKTTPWIDARFTIKSKVHGKSVEPKLDRYLPFSEYGISLTTDAKMTLAELSKYKFHTDIGGGGGTTWFGTIEKLAMPGVLFHHMTSSKDYYHDELIPWLHYIPIKPKQISIKEDLSDVKEMYQWADRNPDEARKISEAGTEYIKSKATPHVMKATYERYFIHSLKKVVDTYQPISRDHEGNKFRDWLSKWSTLVGTCTGRKDEKCNLKNWRVNG